MSVPTKAHRRLIHREGKTEMNHTMTVKLLGVRGTLPVHGAEFARFGGGTSCVLVRAGGETIILDAGTGLSSRAWADFYPEKTCPLLITHAHVDHLMGFPVFPPLFDPAVRCDVYLKTREGRTAREQVEALMAPPLWPVRTDALKAGIRFHDVPEMFSLGEIHVDTLESCHPGGSTIYKLSLDGVSIVYATDYEPESEYPEDFCAFARECSLLLLDAQYTVEEYQHTRGFGHSTIPRSAAIARRCGARRTILVHHDPKRTDAQLFALEQAVQANNPPISFGRAGEEVYL